MSGIALETAQRAAISEVEKLLQRSEDLKRLPTLLQSYSTKRTAAKAQLSSTTASQIDAVRSGLEVLSNAQKTLSMLRNCYAVIDTLCTECASLIENHDKIQVLSNVHYNLGKTLYDVERIVALPHEAASAEAMLREDVQLMQAYEVLLTTEGTSMQAQQKLHKGSKLKHEDSHNLDYYFDKVKETTVKFEERLWSIIRNFVILGRDMPAMLVNAVRIVELQEMVDAKMESSAMRIVQPKRYKKRSEQQICMCIQDLFAPLLQGCSQLVAAGEDTDKRTREILAQAHDFQIQLADIYDYVTPCFPERYNIFSVIFGQYHEHMSFMLDCIGACSDNLANSDIIQVMAWIGDYQETLRELGIEEDNVQFSTGVDHGTFQLTEKYISRVESTLINWFTNILEADMKSEPKADESGKLWTPGAVDFFRIVNEQLQVTITVSTGNLLLRSGQASLRVMRQFQEAQRKLLETDLPEEMLCAYVNNNMLCYNESTDFADLMEDSLDAAYKGRLDIESQCRGFLDVAKSAIEKLVEAVFKETAFLDLFQKLYHTKDWEEGSTTASILATLNDYFHDYEKHIDPSNFKRLVEKCLEETVARYLAAILTYIKTVDELLLERMQRDKDIIVAAFEEHIVPDKARRLSQPLEDIKDLAASDNVDTFVISYNSLLQACPGMYPLLVERIIVARPDLLKADVKEVMEQFKDVYIDRQKSLGNASPVLPKAKNTAHLFKDKESVYRVALESALRKPEPIPQIVLTEYHG